MYKPNPFLCGFNDILLKPTSSTTDSGIFQIFTFASCVRIKFQGHCVSSVLLLESNIINVLPTPKVQKNYFCFSKGLNKKAAHSLSEENDTSQRPNIFL